MSTIKLVPPDNKSFTIEYIIIQQVTYVNSTIQFEYGPLTRYVKLQVVHAPGMSGAFSRHRLPRNSRTCGGGEYVLGIPGPRLNIKTVLSTYGDFHVKDKTAVRTSYL